MVCLQQFMLGLQTLSLLTVVKQPKSIKCRYGLLQVKLGGVVGWGLGQWILSGNLFVSFSGSEEKSNIEVIILVCTGLAATLFWLLLTLFIRKLRKVR